MAALAEAWSTRFLPAPAVAIRAAVQMLLTVRGLPRAAWWIWAIASSVIRCHQRAVCHGR
jgi:hypothetical protein